MNHNLDRDPRLTAGLGLFAACATSSSDIKQYTSPP